MTYDKLMADIAERVRDWHFDHPNAPTALYLGQAQKAVVPWKNGLDMVMMSDAARGMKVHFTEDADYVALG